MLLQDLHIHTTWSRGDSAVVPEQTLAWITALRHAHTVGISDHLEYVADRYDEYAAAVRAAGCKLGIEINGHEWLETALAVACDYRIFHCYDRAADYRALEHLLAVETPLIIAHPHALNTDLGRVPPQCLVELNNRYLSASDWRAYYGPYRARFRFVLSSDAHQPHWLNQVVARHVAAQLGIQETLLFT